MNASGSSDLKLLNVYALADLMEMGYKERTHDPSGYRYDNPMTIILDNEDTIIMGFIRNARNVNPSKDEMRIWIDDIHDKIDYPTS